jgi:hypothetical protein
VTKDAYLPPGIEAQYQAAVQRTGETDTLKRARVRISQLLYAHPSAVEVMMRTEYQRMT